MGKFIDLTGKRFNRLFIVGRIYPNNKNNNTMWKCRCDCGNYIIVCGSDIIRDHTKSCGCLKIEKAKLINMRHGRSLSSIYEIWHSMIQRCNNPNNISYKHYGGRGIKVCKRWYKFENFLNDMGERPDKLTLDRINNNDGYYKDNCRWVTQQEQRRNSRTNRYITINGITKCLIEWCEDRDIGYNKVRSRLDQHGWNIKEALEFMPRKRKDK